MITGIEPESEHFTIFESHIDKPGIDQFSEAQVRSVEFTFDKLKSREIAVGEITILKDAVFVFSLSQRVFGKVFVGKCLAVDVSHQ